MVVEIVSIGSQLMWSGAVLLTAGAALIILGIIPKTRSESIHRNRRLYLSPQQQPGTLYLNVMLPLSADADISGQITLRTGSLMFRIVGYFGFPAPIPHGQWVSNIFYPNEPDREFVNVNNNFQLPKLHLLRRDYVCEFHVVDDNNPQPFEVLFTVVAKRKGPWLKYSEGAKDLGRLLVAVAVPFIALGVATVLR